MDISIAGAHGQIARHLNRLLAARGDTVRGLIRNPDHATDLLEDGAEPLLLDLEVAGSDELTRAIAGSDAVVFAAGAGPGSGAARKETVDYAAAVKLVEAAEAAGVARYVMVSAMGTENPPARDDDVFSVYVRAKARADEALMASGLAWTVVRPGRLTNDPPTGRVGLDRRVARADIPRADVAEVIRAVLDHEATAGTVFQVVGGDVPIDDAVAALTR